MPLCRLPEWLSVSLRVSNRVFLCVKESIQRWNGAYKPLSIYDKYTEIRLKTFVDVVSRSFQILQAVSIYWSVSDTVRVLLCMIATVAAVLHSETVQIIKWCQKKKITFKPKCLVARTFETSSLLCILRVLNASIWLHFPQNLTIEPTKSKWLFLYIYHLISCTCK